MLAVLGVVVAVPRAHNTCGLGNAHLEQWNRAFAASVADILPTVVWGPTRARLSMSSRLSEKGQENGAGLAVRYSGL